MTDVKECTHQKDVQVTNAHGLQELRCGTCDKRLAWELLNVEIDDPVISGINKHYEQKLRDIVFPKDRSGVT